jgi:hypothetical protein
VVSVIGRPSESRCRSRSPDAYPSGPVHAPLPRRSRCEPFETARTSAPQAQHGKPRNKARQRASWCRGVGV